MGASLSSALRVLWTAPELPRNVAHPRTSRIVAEVDEVMADVEAGVWACVFVAASEHEANMVAKRYRCCQSLRQRYEVRCGGGELWFRRRPTPGRITATPIAPPTVEPPSLATDELAEQRPADPEPVGAGRSDPHARANQLPHPKPAGWKATPAEFAAVYKDTGPEGGHHSAEQTGDILGISRSTAYTLRNRARQEGLI